MAELGFSLLTVKAYADAVHKSEDTIRRWIHEGKLRARKDKGGHGWLILIRDNDDLFTDEAAAN